MALERGARESATSRRYFSRQAMDEAQALRFTPEEASRRRLVEGAISIDPEGSPDPDDAIGVTFRSNVYTISISVTDLASFIPNGSQLDVEARERFMTIYLPPSPKNNIPMLPRVLSENRFALAGDGLKPTLTTTIPVTRDGQVGEISVELTSTQVLRAYSHETADVMLEQGEGRVVETLKLARQAAVIISKMRGQPSHSLVGVPLRTRFERQFRLPEEKYATRRIVQEFMILHNWQIAKFFKERGIPIIYRNHTPSEETFLDERQSVQEILRRATVAGQEVDEESLWKRAYFDVEVRGHKGLGLSGYAHFSSPIRRYQDLVNQRVLLATLNNEPSPYSLGELKSIATFGNLLHKK